MPSPSPASSQNGEGLYSVNEGPSADINNGAGTYLATNTYAMGIGPVRESRGEPYEYHGTGKVVAADGTSYSADDDWTLGEDYRFQQDYILKESYLLAPDYKSPEDGLIVAVCAVVCPRSVGHSIVPRKQLEETKKLSPFIGLSWCFGGGMYET